MPLATPKKGDRNKEAVIQVRVEPRLKAAATELAEQDGITVTALITQLLMREMKARGVALR